MDEEMDPIAKGFWCPTCESFEDELGTDFTAEKCDACGCREDLHIEVKLVSIHAH